MLLVHLFLQLPKNLERDARTVAPSTAKILANNIVVWLVMRMHVVVHVLVAVREHVGEIAIKVAYKLVLARVAIIAMALVHILV